ncbi:hypothetical protein [Larkinella sp.]|uniref:hypothetical protein n=1 Tax=Larkinella sp. TaxID=2034517 RepID=UPI003BADA139
MQKLGGALFDLENLRVKQVIVDNTAFAFQAVDKPVVLVFAPERAQLLVVGNAALRPAAVFEGL